jgi:hypothetical protein
LINETEFSYSYYISTNAYKMLNYNYEFEKQASSLKKVAVVINRKEGVEPFSIDSDKELENAKFKILFARYKKMLLVKVKSIKPPKNFRNKDYQEIIKYL